MKAGALPHAIVLNRRANGGTSARAWDEVLHEPWAIEAGLSALPIFEGPLENLSNWLHERLGEGRSNFLACGGDGTVNSLVNAVLASPALSQEAKLGAIALGSSNDFHKPFDSPARDRIAGKPARMRFEKARLHDIGLAIFPRGERAFAINASVGVTAEANDFFNRGPAPIRFLKRRWVDGAILASALMTFARYRNLKLELEVQDERRETLLTNLSVIKNRHFSGSFRYGSGPQADDGNLHVHLCERMSRAEMLGTLAALSRGRFERSAKRASSAASLASVRSPEGQDFAIETDGEVIRAASVRFEILPRRLWLCP